MEVPDDVGKWHDAAVKLAREAGEVIRNAIGNRKTIETKACYADLVTETDKEVEDLLISGLKSQFPSHRFIGEESTASGVKCELTDAPTWIIDPVDGTMNFVHGLPMVAVSIGLTYKKNVILGIIYVPMLDKMYTAIHGRGAYCNKKQLQVSGETELSKAMMLTEHGSLRTEEAITNVFTNMRTFASQVHAIRSLGSAACNMCAVASGAADFYFEYTFHCWDMAAGKVIIEEAGGVVIDPEGGDLDLMRRRVLCAASKELAMAVSKQLVHIQVAKD